MKKLFAVLMCSAFLFSGCSGTRIGDELKRDMKEEVDDMKEDISDITATAPDKENLISEDKAKELALSKAGLKAEEVTFERTKLEVDDGAWQYDIEFRKDTTEYSAEINATDGSFISWEVDND